MILSANYYMEENRFMTSAMQKKKYIKTDGALPAFTTNLIYDASIWLSFINCITN